MAESVNPFLPDGRLSRSALERMGQSTSRQESIFGGMNRINIGPGATTIQGDAESFWVQITAAGGAPCTGGYSATEVARVGCDDVPEGDARTWDVAGNPAWEVNKRTDVPIGAIVRAYNSAVPGQIEFYYCCEGTPPVIPCDCPEYAVLLRVLSSGWVSTSSYEDFNGLFYFGSRTVDGPATPTFNSWQDRGQANNPANFPYDNFFFPTQDVLRQGRYFENIFKKSVLGFGDFQEKWISITPKGQYSPGVAGAFNYSTLDGARFSGTVDAPTSWPLIQWGQVALKTIITFHFYYNGPWAAAGSPGAVNGEFYAVYVADALLCNQSAGITADFFGFYTTAPSETLAFQGPLPTGPDELISWPSTVTLGISQKSRCVKFPGTASEITRGMFYSRTGDYLFYANQTNDLTHARGVQIPVTPTRLQASEMVFYPVADNVWEGSAQTEKLTDIEYDVNNADFTYDHQQAVKLTYLGSNQWKAEGWANITAMLTGVAPLITWGPNTLDMDAVNNITQAKTLGVTASINPNSFNATNGFFDFY